MNKGVYKYHDCSFLSSQERGVTIMKPILEYVAEQLKERGFTVEFSRPNLFTAYRGKDLKRTPETNGICIQGYTGKHSEHGVTVHLTVIRYTNSSGVVQFADEPKIKFRSDASDTIIMKRIDEAISRYVDCKQVNLIRKRVTSRLSDGTRIQKTFTGNTNKEVDDKIENYLKGMSRNV